MPRYESISIIGHNSDSGLHAFESCDKEQQPATKFAIENHQQPKRGKISPEYFRKIFTKNFMQWISNMMVGLTLISNVSSLGIFFYVTMLVSTVVCVDVLTRTLQ